MRDSQPGSGSFMAGVLAFILGTLFVLLVVMAALAFGI